MDGFEIDFADNSGGLWDAYEKGSNRTIKYLSTNPRTGSGCVQFAGPAIDDSWFSKTLPSSYIELFVGFGVKFSGSIYGEYGGTFQLCAFYSSDGSVQVTIAMNNTSHVIEVWYWDTRYGTKLGSGSVGLVTDVWSYVEVNVIIDDTVGAVTVRLNGSEEIALTGVDTNKSGGDIKVFRLGNQTDAETSGTIYYDDVIINDTSGTVANSWPNQAGIYPLTPNGDGSYSEWTSTGANNYGEIDDLASYGSLPDGATSMLSSNTINTRASVTLTDTAVGGPVQSVMLIANHAVAATGADQMAQFVRVNGTDYDQTAFGGNVAFGYHTDILSENPDTGAAWLTTEIDDLEVGFKRVS